MLQWSESYSGESVVRGYVCKCVHAHIHAQCGLHHSKMGFKGEPHAWQKVKSVVGPRKFPGDVQQANRCDNMGS